MANPAGPAPRTTTSKRAPIHLGAQAELVRDLGDRRAAQHVVGANEHGAFLGADAEPLEQRPTLGVCVDVVPAERDQVALQELANGERLARRAPPDQPFVAEALASQPLTTRDHGAQEEVSQLVGAGHQRAQRVGWYRKQRGLLGGDRRGRSSARR